VRKFINSLPKELMTARRQWREEDIRGPFFRDQTAIIHSLAFRRLKHKTQVFFSPENDHICTRIEHSLHVATISATICRALGLDVDLATAIGLGHDLGHAPFGHAGEAALSSMIEGGFIHEIHSLRVVDQLENYGQGLNLTFAVRDGIIAHCGEVDEQFTEIAPEPNDLTNVSLRPLRPSTWEGCVVRLSDSIAYLGRDLEDAISANLLNAEDLPENVKKKLGSTNSEIINNLVWDVIDWSRKNGKIGFSPQMFAVVQDFKQWSREKIYANAKLSYWNDYANTVLRSLFRYLQDLYQKNGNDFERYAQSRTALNVKFGKYLKSLQERYTEVNWDAAVILRDYLAGMTDAYALRCFQNILSTGTIGL
jgi:dGTPase